MALILGVYERLITAISHVDLTLWGHVRRGKFAAAAKHLDLRFLVPLGLGVAVALGVAACGPRVFEAESAKLITAVRPPPPPEKPPPKAEARVEVTQEKIVIHDKIQFEYNRARILPESDALLAEIAGVIEANPQLQRIRVEGHASAEGSRRRNLELSKQRAEAVRDHLVERGRVDPARLEFAGYGPDQPIADNDTEAGREANRRVEFTILERAESEAEAP